MRAGAGRPAPARRRLPALRAVLGLALLAVAAAVIGPAACSRGSFKLTGTITAAPRLQRTLDQPNLVLYITASNPGGVPVAVKRYINPRLPLHYSLNDDDLVLPGRSWEGALTVRVTANVHGEAGVAKPGDLAGRHPGTARSGDRQVNIVIDEEL